MNIVFITPSIGYAGAAKMLTFVANQLHERGHRVSIINLKTTTGEVAQTVDEDIRVVEISGRVGTAKKLGVLKQIRQVAKEEQAQLIIGFTMFANLYAVLVGRSMGIPSIICERGDPYRTVGTGLKDKLVMSLVNSSKGGVFQTEGARDFYGKGLQKRGVVIANPIFIKGELPQVEFEQRTKTVVSVGRLDNHQKRFDVKLRAFALFAQKNPQYTLRIYGDGPDEQMIRDLAKELGIEEKVQLLGRTSQPMQDMAQDGMFLITSDFEGISNSLLEAMAVGLPCVSTDHTPGGARLLIQNEENGLLAPVGDAAALAAAMNRFAKEPELAKRCGEEAKQVINRFSATRIIDQWENYCQQIIKG